MKKKKKGKLIHREVNSLNVAKNSLNVAKIRKPIGGASTQTQAGSVLHTLTTQKGVLRPVPSTSLGSLLKTASQTHPIPTESEF